MRLSPSAAGIAFMLLLWAGAAPASLPLPARNAIESVLNAERVVIVSHDSGDRYRVERAFLGTAKYGDTITVPGFRLYTDQQSGSAKLESVSADTRILMFLYFSHGYLDKPDCWQTTDYNRGFFWEQDPARMDNLANLALTALALRKTWETARDQPDAQARVAALWPFLDLRTYGVSFLWRTEQEMQKAKPISGDYIASRLDTLSSEQRMVLLPQSGQYGGERLHRAVIQLLNRCQAQYVGWLAARGPAAKDKAGEWEQMPPDIHLAVDSLSYGLGGLGSFQDRADLPYIRRLALWAAARHAGGVALESWNEFRQMPDPANLPVIEAVWNTYLQYPVPGQTINPGEVISALSAGNYVAAIPFLAPFLDSQDARVAMEAHTALVRVTGRDVGSTPGAWLAWSAQHRPAHH